MANPNPLINFDRGKSRKDCETEILGSFILLFGGNKLRAAKQLGLSQTTVDGENQALIKLVLAKSLKRAA